ncbi:MAG: toxin-antitoxin system YwqK family antitoxin [Bacteroidales bacterium]|nr:toxin-antitoxin system YwqK family antitoxin [Bacteroidales bacterium]
MRLSWRMLLCVCLVALVACNNQGEVKKDYWDNGNLKSVLRYQDGQLNGICEWYLLNGKPQMEATYKDNKMNGLLRRWHENGNIMEESWYKDGVQDSVFRTYSLKGILAEEGYYVDGELNGEYKRWYENGQVFQEGQYADGMMDGSWLIFYSDGSLAATANFDKGTGTQTSYEQSGYKCLVTHFVDNEKHGKETYYNPDGRVTRVAVYEYGEWVRDE